MPSKHVTPNSVAANYAILLMISCLVTSVSGPIDYVIGKAVANNHTAWDELATLSPQDLPGMLSVSGYGILVCFATYAFLSNIAPTRATSTIRRPLAQLLYLVNFMLSLQKETAMASVLGSSTAVPWTSCGFWLVRDVATVATVSGDVPLAEGLRMVIPLNAHAASLAASVIAPVVIQFITTPLHLLGLHYERAPRDGPLTDLARHLLGALALRLFRSALVYGLFLVARHRLLPPAPPERKVRSSPNEPSKQRPPRSRQLRLASQRYCCLKGPLGSYRVNLGSVLWSCRDAVMWEGVGLDANGPSTVSVVGFHPFGALAAEHRVRQQAGTASVIQSQSPLDHPNILKTLDLVVSPGVPPCLVKEAFPGSCSLTHLIQCQGPLWERTAFRYGIQLLGAVAHIHHHGTLLGDLKLDDIVVRCSDEALKLVWLGALIPIDPAQRSPVVPSASLALGLHIPSIQADLQAVGRCCISMLTGVLQPVTRWDHLALDSKTRDLLTHCFSLEHSTTQELLDYCERVSRAP